MPLADYLEGILWLVVTAGSAAAAAGFVLRRAFGTLAGSAAAAAYGLLLVGALVAVHLLPGLLGVLTRGSVAATAVALVALSAWWARGAGEQVRPSRSAPAPSTRAEWAIAAAAIGVATVFVVAFLAQRRGVPTLAIDALTFELPGIAEIMRDGSVWPVRHHWFGWAFGTYPQSGELVMLSTMLPWRSDAFLLFLFAPLLAFCGVAVYALARELGARRAPAATFAAVLVSTPASLLTALDLVKPDPIMLACFTAGLTFLVRHARTRSAGDLVLGGLGLGLALGTKWYGLSYAAVVLVVWTVAHAAAGRPLPQVARGLGAVSAVTLAAGGFWLLRNLVGTGNPLYPAKIELLGVTIFDAPRDWRREEIGFSLLDYADRPALWRSDLLPEMRDLFALPGALAAAVVVATLAAWLLRRGADRDLRALWLAAAGLLMLGAYAATPYTAQGAVGEPDVFPAARYALPALAIGAALAAVLARHATRWALALQLLGLAAVIDGAWQAGDGLLTAGRVAAAIVVVVLGAAAVATARAVRPARWAIASAAAAAAVAIVVAGHVHQDRYAESRYRGIDASIDWVLAKTTEPQRIGVTGHGPPSNLAPIALLPFAGPRYGNEVEVMGRVVRHQLNELRGREDFDAALRHGDYDLLVVMLRHPRERAPEEAWARRHGFRVVARGRTAAIMADGRERQPLEPRRARRR